MAEVARAPAEQPGVERDDDRAVSGLLCTMHEARGQVAVLGPVELIPATGLPHRLCHLLDRVRGGGAQDVGHAVAGRRPARCQLGLGMDDRLDADGSEHHGSRHRCAKQRAAEVAHGRHRATSSERSASARRPADWRASFARRPLRPPRSRRPQRSGPRGHAPQGRRRRLEASASHCRGRAHRSRSGSRQRPALSDRGPRRPSADPTGSPPRPAGRPMAHNGRILRWFSMKHGWSLRAILHTSSSEPHAAAARGVRRPRTGDCVRKPGRVRASGVLGGRSKTAGLPVIASAASARPCDGRARYARSPDDVRASPPELPISSGDSECERKGTDRTAAGRIARRDRDRRLLPR